MFRKIRQWFFAWASSASKIKLEFKWSIKDQCFYLNSPMGLVVYKPRSLAQRTMFRDDIGNRVLSLLTEPDLPPVTNELRGIYYDAIRNYKAEYRATLRMRLRLVI
jgi:hypothetical protein